MKSNAPAVLKASSKQVFAQMQCDAILERMSHLDRQVSILECGCGRRWPLNLHGLHYKLTGIDLDPIALEFRKTNTSDLDVAICGDLCSVEIPESSFDVVYSGYVLEHIPQADVALQNFAKWLRPGGLLILLIPDPRTVRGFSARILPFWVHVLWCRIQGDMKAGTPGHSPYPTEYHPMIHREKLSMFLRDNGMKLICCYGDGFRQETRSKVANFFLKSGMRIVSFLSFGYLDSSYANLLYIAEKTGDQG
jgi:SAM-dependent methyltransferase